MPSVSENIETIRQQIRESAGRVHRDPAQIRIVAMAKGFDPSAIREALTAGIADIGENYLQESLPKQQALTDLPITWHFTGNLQRNKALRVAERFALIQSLDSIRLAETVNAAGATLGRPIRALLQLKASALAPHGFLPQELLNGVEKLRALRNLQLEGLMTLGVPVNRPEDARPLFRQTKEIFLAVQKKLPEIFKDLSMGMSGDFRVAIEEGATMVRIGRAIFGERPKRGTP